MHIMRKLPQLRDPRCFAGWLPRSRCHGDQPAHLQRHAHGAEPEFSTRSLDECAVSGKWKSRRTVADPRRPGSAEAPDRQTLKAFYLRTEPRQMSAVRNSRHHHAVCVAVS